MNGSRGAQEGPRALTGRVVRKDNFGENENIGILKNEWCVPGPAGVARPTEAGRPVFSCVMRWPWRPAASKIRLPGWPVGPRLRKTDKVVQCKNEKNENNNK